VSNVRYVGERTRTLVNGAQRTSNNAPRHVRKLKLRRRAREDFVIYFSR